MYENEPMNKIAEPGTPSGERPSFSIDTIRKEYDYEAVNAENHAKKLSEHIQAIDDELEALSEERGRLAEMCLKATMEMSEIGQKYAEIAKNDYRG